MTSSHPLSGYQVGNVGFFGLPQTFDPRLDVRGVLWLWELPRKDATYVIGADPTQGVTGWTPQTSTDSDRKIDNASIEVLRVGRIRLVQTGKEARQVREPDVQVAEFAAPIDAIAFAHVINAVGKLYRGDSDEEGCLVNIEVYPGPGIATFPELYAKLGYVNIFRQPYLDGSVKRKIDFGFTASQQSKQLLWTQGVRHLRKNGVKINSPWLLEELVDAVASNFITSTWRSDPQHDDRFTGLLLALWCVPPDTRLHLVSGGLVKISDIRLGDMVMGRNGPEYVEAIYVRNVKESLRCLNISGQYIGLRCTGEHKVLVQRCREHNWDDKKHKSIKGSSLEWVRALEVRKGYRVLVPAEFDLPPTHFTGEQLYLMGWYLAEGFVNRNTIVLTLGPKEVREAKILKDIADRWLDACQGPYRGSKSRKARIREARTALLVAFSSPVLSKLFRSLFGTGAKSKNLSPDFLRTSGLLPFVRGWAEGDGNVYKGRLRITTVSEMLAWQMRQVLLNHSIWCCVHRRQMGERILEGRVLPPCISYVLLVGRPGLRQLYGDKAYRCAQRITQIPEGFLTPVMGVDDEFYEGPVWDVRTTNHSFSAEGVIVHNCAHSWAMDLSEVEETHLQPIQDNIPDFQRSLISLEKMKEAEAERWDMIQDALTNRG